MNVGRGRRYLERKRAELAGDDTYGPTEPEPVDVYAEQGPSDWSREPSSDELLGRNVRHVLEAGRKAFRP